MSLQEMNIKRQAQSLERNLLGVIHFLEDTYDNFQQLCRVFNPKRGYAPTTAKDIREIYKTANAKIAEARSLQQVLRGKYKAYVQVGAQQQRAVEEFSLMYRKDYRFFEQNQSQWQREQRVEKEKAVPSRLLSHLYALYQESPSFPSIILCFQGDVSALKELQERFPLGERDIYEIVGDEIWLLLAGVKPPEDSILRSKLTETFVHGVHGRVKGVVLKLTTGKEVREDVLRGMRRSLAEIKDGEINIL
jgi:hypothetical protein